MRLTQVSDIDAPKVVSKGVNAGVAKASGAMIITHHYQRLWNYITPDVVHVMMEGKVVLSGGPGIAARLEQEGYAKIAEGARFTSTTKQL